MNKPQLAFFVCFGGAVLGCTSLLGDFDVGPATNGPSQDAGGGLTKCGDTLVDLKTSTANCGACNRACPSGLSCGDGNCQCADKGAFCDGQCFAATDRAHCGPTCAACSDGQVCDGKCSDPPAAAFEKVPLSATGWKDGAGAALAITVKNTNQPGTIYECRTGPAGTFSPEIPAWRNCDGATGEGRVHQPTPDAAAPEGTYRTEHRYKLGTFVSQPVGTRYYVHKSLDNVATCPRQGVPLDGPHFTDQQFFIAATAFANANPIAFPTATTFPVAGEKPSDDLYLGNPWIKIPFTSVAHTKAMNASSGIDDDPWPAAGKNYLFNERSLRHKWVMNAARTMILVSRQYIHPKTNDCKQTIQVGGELETQYGPPGRGIRKLDCEAYVLNTRGNAICLAPNGPKIESIVVPADTRIPIDDAQDGGQSLGKTFQAFNNGVVVTSTAPAFKATMVGGFLQIPEGTGRWYQIAEFQNDKAVVLTEPYKGNGANLPAGSQVRFTAKAQSINVIGTGFAKLHQNAHAWATGKKHVPAVTGPQISHPMPSHRTKCDTPKCNCETPECLKLKPWLTFLPP